MKNFGIMLVSSTPYALTLLLITHSWWWFTIALFCSYPLSVLQLWGMGQLILLSMGTKKKKAFLRDWKAAGVDDMLSDLRH